MHVIAGIWRLFLAHLAAGRFDALLGALAAFGFFYHLAQAAREWRGARWRRR